MRTIRAWFSRFGNIFDKRRRDRELSEELESHLAFHIDENIRCGMSPGEARRQAFIKLGGTEFPVKEQIKLQFRAEVFNLFNSPNFSNPNTTLSFLGTSTTGVKNSVLPVNLNVASVPGQVTSMNGNWNQREIQFALKLLF